MPLNFVPLTGCGSKVSLAEVSFKRWSSQQVFKCPKWSCCYQPPESSKPFDAISREILSSLSAFFLFYFSNFSCFFVSVSLFFSSNSVTTVCVSLLKGVYCLFLCVNIRALLLLSTVCMQSVCFSFHATLKFHVACVYFSFILDLFLMTDSPTASAQIFFLFYS